MLCKTGFHIRHIGPHSLIKLGLGRRFVIQITATKQGIDSLLSVVGAPTQIVVKQGVTLRRVISESFI
ncbi:hypothetical protein D3C78_1660690 [compost metagenome]